jgi:hypothetical protein
LGKTRFIEKFKEKRGDCSAAMEPKGIVTISIKGGENVPGEI